MPTGAVMLALNSGSSSLKYGLCAVERGVPASLLSGTIETTDAHGSFFDAVATALSKVSAPAPTVISHRIVHGGPHRSQHCLIDDAATVESIRTGLAWLPGLRVSTIASQEDDQIARHASLLAPPTAGRSQAGT